jgi:hypothetical protein
VDRRLLNLLAQFSALTAALFATVSAKLRVNTLSLKRGLEARRISKAVNAFSRDIS